MNQAMVARQFAHHDAAARTADVVMRLKALLASQDPAVVADVLKANQSLLNCKLLTPGAVHIDSSLSSLSVQYKNEEYIGIQMCPVITVAKPSDKYFIYSKRDRMGAPDASVGTRSTPNEISENRSTASYSTEPFALLDFLDDRTARAQDAPLNEMVDLIAAVNDVMDLLEEIRIATLLTTAANYGGNTATLSGTDQWSHASSDPVKKIFDAIDSLWSGPGKTRLKAACAPEVLTALRRHPKVVDQFKHTGSQLPNAQQLAAFFGFDELLVGGARKDTANEGQTAAYGRVWGDDFVINRVAVAPGPRQAYFSTTFRFGQKQTTQWFDPKPGVSGGYYGKVGMEECHNVIAAETGYLFKDCLA